MCVTQTPLCRTLLCKAKPPARLGTLALLFKMLAVLQSSSVLVPWDRWPQLGCASEIPSPPADASGAGLVAGPCQAFLQPAPPSLPAGCPQYHTPGSLLPPLLVALRLCSC